MLLFISYYLPMNTLIEAIAKAYGIETLETQMSDAQDFHDIAVWNLKAMLEEAYKKGLEDAKNQK